MGMNDDESILSLSFTPDSQWLISGHSVTGDLRVWNAQYLSKKYQAFYMAAHEMGTYTLDMQSSSDKSCAGISNLSSSHSLQYAFSCCELPSLIVYGEVILMITSLRQYSGEITVFKFVKE